MVGDEGVLSGVLTSPDYPYPYPNNHDSTQTIEVAEGKTIKYVFTNFNTEPEHDYVQLVGNDGIDPYFLSGSGQGTPSAMSSKSNIMHVKFHTDGNTQRSGWRMEWTESE